jgi:hypothetical protein
MAQLPGSFDEAFPADAENAAFKGKSFDDLFPADVERERYRRQTLGTSPIQDLIFGGVDVNPVARVLDHFGQGAKQGWGAEPLGISKESEDALKKAGIFNDYDNGQRSIIKAANESLFRGAATYLVEPIMRGLPAAFRGTQEAIAQVGEEVGQPKLGREAAGALEAFPAGFRQPTGVPHAPPHPILAEIERARDAGVIGAGEGGWKGTADVPASTVKTEAELVKRDMPAEAKPVDPTEAPKVEPAEPAIAAPAEAVGPSVDATHPIAQDIARKLEHAGRPAEEASASGQLIANYYETRAARFEGALGTADELYAREGADIRGPGGKKAVAVEAAPGPKPVEGGAAEPAPIETAQSRWDDFSATRQERDKIQALATGYNGLRDKRGLPLRGKATQIWEPGNIVDVGFVKNLLIAAKNEDGTFTLLSKPDKNGQSKSYEIKRHEGIGKGSPADFMEATTGLKSREFAQTAALDTPEFKNWFVESKVVDEAGNPQVVYHGTTAAFDEFDAGKGGSATGAKSAEKGFFFSSSPEVASSYAVGSNVYKDNPFLRFVNKMTGGAYERANEAILKRVGGKSAIRDGENVMPVYLSIKNPMEVMFEGKEYRERSFASLIDEAKANGHDGVVFRDAIDPGFEGGNKPSDIYVTFDPKQIKSATGNSGAFDPNSPKIYEQIKRGVFNLKNGQVKPIITLLKDQNASTFIHETGHQWLEDLGRDTQHPKAPEALKADGQAVLEWLGIEKFSDIKVKQHEKFARGFERYMMEGKAPSQGLANVFAKFKNWLTSIYQTVTKLKAPINDEIRGVFDRLIALKPEQVKIEPETPPKSFADIHEADALSTSPASAHPVAETIQAERDRLANEVIPEEHDARLEGIAAKAERREAGGPQPVRDGNEAGTAGREAAGDQASGAVSAGGSELTAESAGASTGARTEPVSPQDPFVHETPLVDKAGNIRLDNLGTPEEVSQVIRDAAIANNDFIDARRGVVTDGQVLELADALGMDEGMLNRRKLGEAFNAEQVMAARKLLIQSATAVRDAMQKAATGGEAEIMAYAEAKRRHSMIANNVAGITSEAGRALRAFKKLEGQDEAAAISKFVKDETGKTLFQLQREAQLGMQLETPAQVSKFVNDTTKPKFSDMVIEAWMSALLSGPKTHVANILGNTITGIVRPVETAMAAGIGKVRNMVTGAQDRVLPGEAAAELFGAVQGAREGVVAAYKAYKTGEGQLTTAQQVEKHNPRALPSATINLFGKERQIGGEQARIPLRLLAAEDEFFKSVSFRGDIHRQAYAQAAKEGLPAEQMATRVAELSANPTDAMIEAAKKVAEYQTFQTPLGKFGRSLQAISNAHPLLKVVLPFIRTPLNLLKYANERTPLGVFSSEVRDNLSGKNGGVARDTQLARIATGTMVGIAAYEMASQGLITGGGPADAKEKAILKATGWQEYSVKIGDTYYSYRRLDPFSTILGVVSDAYELSQKMSAADAEKHNIPALVMGSISKTLLDKASLKGTSDLVQAATQWERFGDGYVRNLVGTVVPAISAQSAQTLDPVVREARTVLDNLRARVPGLSQTLMPKRDVWGEPMMREGGLGPDIASPIAQSRLKNDPVNKALLDAHYYPSKVDRKIRGVELNEQQYDDFARIAGRTAKLRLNAIVGMPGFSQMPEVTRKELMTNTITSSREMARSIIMMQNPEILKKATDAKLKGLK